MKRLKLIRNLGSSLPVLLNFSMVIQATVYYVICIISCVYSGIVHSIYAETLIL